MCIFKYNTGKANNKFIIPNNNNKFILLNNFYPVISYRRVRKECDELLYTVWSLVMVRGQLPAQVVKRMQLSDFLNYGVLYGLYRADSFVIDGKIIN